MLEQRQEPVAAGVASEPLDLGKVQRQVMGQHAMPHLGLGPRDRFMGLRQLLQIVDAGPQRVVVDARRADPEHVQDHLGVLGIVLVPAVVQRLASAGESQHEINRASNPASARRHAIGGDSSRSPRSRRSPACHRPARCDQAVVLGASIEHGQPTSALMARCIDQNFIAVLGNVDGYERRGGGYRFDLVMVGLSGMGLDTHILEKP